MFKRKNAMRGEMNLRMVYGSQEFSERMKRKCDIEKVIKPKGRPKKDEEEK